jgi:hypothetical protein
VGIGDDVFELAKPVDDELVLKVDLLVGAKLMPVKFDLTDIELP